MRERRGEPRPRTGTGGAGAKSLILLRNRIVTTNNVRLSCCTQTHNLMRLSCDALYNPADAPDIRSDCADTGTAYRLTDAILCCHNYLTGKSSQQSSASLRLTQTLGSEPAARLFASLARSLDGEPHRRSSARIAT